MTFFLLFINIWGNYCIAKVFFGPKRKKAWLMFNDCCWVCVFCFVLFWYVCSLGGSDSVIMVISVPDGMILSLLIYTPYCSVSSFIRHWNNSSAPLSPWVSFSASMPSSTSRRTCYAIVFVRSRPERPDCSFSDLHRFLQAPLVKCFQISVSCQETGIELVVFVYFYVAYGKAHRP